MFRIRIIVESCCTRIDNPRVLLLGMLDIDYSSIDSSSSYIICTPMKMKESRLSSYLMLGIRAYCNWFDSGAAMMNVYTDSVKEDATFKLDFSNSISADLNTSILNSMVTLCMEHSGRETIFVFARLSN